MCGKLNSKGFTIIELLIAMLFLMFVMIGFLRGVSTYIQFSLDARMKDTASKAIRDWSGYLESLPYNASLISPDPYPNSSNNWGNASIECYDQNNCTSFKITAEDTNSDGDNISDFYDPYNGNNYSDYFKNHPLDTADWLLIGPKPHPLCDDPNIQYNCPPRQYSIGNRRIYVGITVARLIQKNNEIGKAFGITAWYFSPIDNRYKYVSTTLIKRKP